MSYIQIRISTSSAKAFCRIPHDIERVDMNKGTLGDLRYRPNAGMSGRGVVRKTILEAGVARPEIYRVDPDHTTPIAEKHQRLWKNINPELAGIRWRTLLGNKLAWTNSSGFPGRRDYINNLDMDKSLPNFDAPRVNGGAIHECIVEGSRVWLISLLTSAPVPSIDAMLSSYLWSWGTSVSPDDGHINLIKRLGMDGQYKQVRIPFLTNQKVWLPRDEVHILQPGEFPEPTWMFV